MAGYDWGRGKSNNAVWAEEDGLMTATQCAKYLRDQGFKGCTSKAVKDLVPEKEWHHTSKFYNETSYYDPTVAAEYMAEHLDGWKARQKQKKCSARTVTGTIEWTEWVTKRERIEHTYTGEFQIKGDWVIFEGRRKNRFGRWITVMEDAINETQATQ